MELAINSRIILNEENSKVRYDEKSRNSNYYKLAYMYMNQSSGIKFANQSSHLYLHIRWIQQSERLFNYNNLTELQLINRAKKMQARPAPSKFKYKIALYAAEGSHAVNAYTYLPNKHSCRLFCICNEYSAAREIKCSRCKEAFHFCVANKMQNRQTWVCLPCQSKYMDPIYHPDQILLQTFFKTESVYVYANIIQFVFYLTNEQLKNPVEVRGLQDGRHGLAWPMHGQFFINRAQNPQSIIDFKPLITNSNRKFRKQQALILPADKLKLGKNVLTFAIPKLNSTTYEARYQVELRAIYFIGIYAIKKLSKQQLIQKTFRNSKIDREASIAFLLKDDKDLAFQKQTLNLQCPYTRNRIKIPIRGKKCAHYLVICLDTLIQSRAIVNSREWPCPICNQDINEPVIDMFIFQILNDGKVGVDVIIQADGSYEWVPLQKQNINLSSDSDNELPKTQIKKNKTKKFKQKAQIKNKSDNQKKQPPKPQLRLQTNPQQKQSKPKNIETIDLDDDQAPAPISVPKSAQTKLPTQIPTQIPAQIPAQTRTPIRAMMSVPPARKTISSHPFKLTPVQSQQIESKSVPLEIMIPQETQRIDRQKQEVIQSQKLRQGLIDKKKKDTQNQNQFIRANPKKDGFLITDVKQLEFKSLTFSDFHKKYFNYEYSRANINEDLKSIFSQVL